MPSSPVKQPSRIVKIRRAHPLASPSIARKTSADNAWSRLTRVPALCLFLVIATTAVYAPIAKHEFIDYDDDVYVFDNPHVVNGLSWQDLRWALTTDAAGNWHPVTWISHMLDCQVYGVTHGGGHHVTSMVLHAFNVILLFLFLYRATGAKGQSFVVSALFALHPFNVESVAWIAERKNVLCTFFFLVGLLAYLWYARKPSPWRYGAVALSFGLGLASKPMVITFPFVLLLLDFWPLGRVERYSSPSTAFPVRPMRFGRLVLEKLPLLLFSAASAVVTLVVQTRGKSIAPITASPFSWRLKNAIWAYATYLWKTLVPIRLAPFYPTDLISMRAVLLSAAAVVGLGWFAWKVRKTQPYLAVGYFWFLGTLIPVIGLVEVGSQSMADRYVYIPLIGIFVVLVWGVQSLSRGQHKAWLAAGSSLVLLALAVVTWRQVGYWKDSVTLWSHARAVTPLNFVAEEDLGVGLANQGHNDEALVHLVIAQKIRPVDDTAALNIGINLEAHQLHQPAILEFEHVVRYSENPDRAAEAHRRMGIIYAQAKDFQKGRDQLIEAFKLTPNDPLVMQNLAMLEADEAVDKFSRAMPSHPSAQDYFQLGQLHEHALNVREAKSAYDEALKINPNLADARRALDQLSQNQK